MLRHPISCQRTKFVRDVGTDVISLLEVNELRGASPEERKRLDEFAEGIVGAAEFISSELTGRGGSSSR
jgi:hypothetical protein